MQKTFVVLAALIALTALPALAQKPDLAGGAVVGSEPGKAAVARTVEVAAQVVAIDKATRTVTLKGPRGNIVDVVVVRALQSLTLALQKTKSGGAAISATETAVQAKPGQRPAAAAAREVTAIAKVTAVDRKASTISLRGPRGNTVTLDVQNPDHFKVVKVGDEVQVVYTEAVAISVEPAAKKPAKK